MSNSITLTSNEYNGWNLTFDLKDEKINKLDSKTLLELEKAIEKIAEDKEAKILIIYSNKKNIFIAGADINEIKDLTTQKEALEKVKRGQDIFNKIANLKIPTIAVINGACLGGGLELALACKYRFAVTNPKTVLALPEVSLGIIPGFGGTQRLPKLIGLSQSLNLILSGKTIKAKQAFKIGLVDMLIREEFLPQTISEFINLILHSPKKNEYLEARKKARTKHFILENLIIGKKLICYFAKKRTR
jgi:3-hydroxyacyl-CoA dehydrogenase/enoyl-CoA hydratase/3-hydroxybutyryl-CoA epimerase